jgi:phosphodiesterase/alkaline phosphatase D-like protein
MIISPGLRKVAAFFIVGLLGSVSLQAALVRGPYLQSVAPKSIVVRWRTDAPESSFVRYGLATDRLSETAALAESVTEHIVTLSLLQPDTKYYYSVGTASTTLVHGEEFFFVTSPPAASPKPVKFWVLGDPGTADEKARAVRDSYERFVGEHPADFCLLLGDNAYPDGTDEEY